MIRASAGSGKTYQLANRYLALMALGVKPEKIIALTFTKKSAAEFSDRILSMLAKGAENATNAQALSIQITGTIQGNSSMAPLVNEVVELPIMDVAFFRGLLENVVKVIDRLALQTLDSFFIKLLRNFAFELGMSGFDLIEGGDLEIEKSKILEGIFTRGERSKEQSAAMKEFVAAFRQSVIGDEGVKQIESLKEFVKDHHHRWLKFPAKESWGGDEYLLKDLPEGGNYKAKVQRARDLLEGVSDLPAGLDKLCDELEDRDGKEGSTFKVSAIFKRLLAGLVDLKEGRYVEVSRGKEKVISGSLAEAFYDLIGGLVRDEVAIKIERTQGIYEVIKLYEDRYSSAVRGQGKLSFADVNLVLSGHEGSGIWDEVTRELVEFRIDGNYDHWMLDEFQDTSRPQLKVIQNLLDEVANNDEGERSLFVVGDTKQGIYGWRGGDPALFDQLDQRYPKLTESSMDTSYRSSASVIDLVNKVCDPKTSKGMELFPKAAVDRWKFETHSIAGFNKDKPGHSWVCEMDELEKDDPEKDDLKNKWIGALVEKIDPVRNGISCAILVRSNKTGGEIANYLREHHASIPVAVDSESTIAEDNPVSAVLTDAFRFLCYPGDTMAWWHIQMSPFRDMFMTFSEDEAEPSKQKVWYHWMKQIAENGVDTVLNQWITQLSQIAEISKYSRSRLDEMELAASKFVKKGGSLPDWLAMLEQWKQKEVSREGVVQIMTAHKAKGLEFGAVILPDLDSNQFDDFGRLKVLESEQEKDRVLLTPNGDIRKAHPTLLDLENQWAADQCYENFCVLYVMLTRAESATYCLLRAAGKNPKKNGADWIRESVEGCVERDETLGELSGKVLAEFGGWDWLDSLEKVDVTPETVQKITLNKISPRSSAVLATDDHGGDEVNFSSRLMNPRGLNYGTMVHECFQSVEWWSGDLSWNKDESIRKMVIECMDSPAISPYFTEKEGVSVFQEQPIEAMVDGVWISGVIDRLMLSKSADGTVENIAIVDFKTDKIEDMEELRERYGSQMNRYREMLHSIYKIDPAHIYQVMISTHLRKGLVL